LNKNHLKELVMHLKTSPFSILNKERSEIDYIKGVYKKEFKLKLILIKILKMNMKKIPSKFKIS